MQSRYCTTQLWRLGELGIMGKASGRDVWALVARSNFHHFGGYLIWAWVFLLSSASQKLLPHSFSFLRASLSRNWGNSQQGGERNWLLFHPGFSITVSLTYIKIGLNFTYFLNRYLTNGWIKINYPLKFVHRAARKKIFNDQRHKIVIR